MKAKQTPHSMPEKTFERLLLIEDDPGHALLIKRALKDYVGSIEHCETAGAALAQTYSSGHFQLVLSDLNLPDTRGVSHIGQLAEHFAPTPILVLTSSTALSDAVDAMRLGAKDYLVKDFGNEFADSLGLALRRLAHVQEIEAERNRLRKDMELLRFAIENSADGLAVVQWTGDLSWTNSSAKEFLQVHGMQGNSLLSLQWENFRNAGSYADDISRQLAQLPYGGMWTGELQLAGKEIHAYAVTLSRAASREQDTADRPSPCVLWIRDVSELRRREKFQREMLSTTTHDLKGPLGAVLTGAELIEGLTTKGEKVHELALRVHSAAQGILNMIEEFLSARRLQEGSFVLRPSPRSLEELCKPLRSSFSTIAEARGIQLLFEYAPEQCTPPIDAAGFERVLGNLLANALKFTPKGGLVHVSFIRDEEGLHVDVKDSGQGMDSSEAKQLFTRFSRLSRHENLPGSGLGLFVVRCIVEAHGGRVEVQSAPAAGSLFRVHFPEDPPINERGELISLELAGE